MGKASKWFRGLLGLKKSGPKNSPRKKWGFSMSGKENDSYKPKHGVVSGADQYDDVDRKAVAATAIAQEVSVVARHISNSSATAEASLRGVFYGRRREEWAALVLQSHFRAYLSRRALRALKGLVKLQALVRGHLMRKRTADTLRQLQALVRAQRRARVGRVLMSESPLSSMKHFSYHEPATPEKFEHVIRAHSMKHEHSKMLKRNGSKSNGIINYDLEKSHLSCFRTESRLSGRFRESGSFTSDRILEIDAIKPHATPKRRNLFHSSLLSLGSDPNCQSLSPSSGEVQSLSPLNFVQDVDEYSVSSYKRNEFITPTKSDVSRSCLSNYSDNPSYMAYTESSKAKLRSFSAPKQRPSQYETSSSTKRYSVHGQRVSQLQANFANKAYPGSGRLDRLGMPVTGDVGFSGGLVFHRY